MEQTGGALALLTVLSRWRCGKQITWPFRSSGKLNKIWIYVKLFENKNWHVAPSWWSIIKPKKQSVKYIWVISTRGNWKKNIVVISGNKRNSAPRCRNQSRSFPTCNWLFPTSHPSSWARQMLLPKLFHLLPPTPTGGLPQFEPNGKPPKSPNLNIIEHVWDLWAEG